MTERAPRIIAFAGSLRADSYNKKLAQNAAAGARAAGAEVRFIDLKDYPVPVYDADIFDATAADPHALFDQGGKVGGPHSKPMPGGLLRLKAHFRWADGWIIATPMHSGTYPGAFHNLMDWLTRMAPGERPMDNFTSKVVGVVSAVFAGSGSLAIVDVKRLLTTLGCFVVPGAEPVAITTTEEMFDDNGMLRDEAARRGVESTGRRVVRLAQKIGLTGHDG